MPQIKSTKNFKLYYEIAPDSPQYSPTGNHLEAILFDLINNEGAVTLDLLTKEGKGYGFCSAEVIHALANLVVKHHIIRRNLTDI